MFRASDGYPLQYRHWPARGELRGTVIALHGIQSHGGWYEWSSARLAEAGYEVYFLDRRGSGLNSRQRGHAPHEDRLLADVRQFLLQLRWERRDAAPVPTVLMGVSWGGKLATVYAATFPEDFDGLALLYPGLFSQLQPSWRQKLQLEWAASVGWGHVLAPIPLNEPELFTQSPRWQEYMRRDEMALHRVTVDFLRANLRLNNRLLQLKNDLRGPILLLLAGRDEIIDNQLVRQYFSRLSAQSLQQIEYAAARHTLEFEDDREPFLQDLLNWLQGVTLRRSAVENKTRGI